MFLAVAISFDCQATTEKHPINICSITDTTPFSPYNVLSVGPQDSILNIALLFGLDWFADAFIEKFAILFCSLTNLDFTLPFSFSYM